MGGGGGGTTTHTDADYLNFALNLEYLEAEFYLRAATGNGLGASDTGNSTSKTTGGSQVPGLTSPADAVHQRDRAERAGPRSLSPQRARQLGRSSSGHRSDQQLQRPRKRCRASASSFNPFASYSNFLIGAFIFEDVGVTAYHGAAKLLTSKTNLTAAAEIHAVEAYHAAAIRSQIVAAGSTAISTANAVETVRSTLGGGNETTLSATGIVAADPTNSIGFERTTDQVLHIVYGTGGGAGVKGGTFFPSGLNGNISVTQA